MNDSPNAATLAATLTPAQRNAVVDAGDDGRLPSGTAVGTCVALMKRGISGPLEYRNADPDTDFPGDRGHWLTELGHEVRNALQAETEGLPAPVPAEVPEAEAAPEAEAEAEAAPAEAPEAVPAEVPVPTDAGSVTVAAVEAAWRTVQKFHPEVPDVVVISGGGVTESRRKIRITWGHFHADQWTTDGGQRHELLVSGECLGRGARFTLTTVLHEAAHALAHARGVKDTSRAGKYHNRRFVALAAELGLTWPEGKDPDTSFGFSDLELPEATAEKYAEALAALESGRRAWRALVLPGTSSETEPGETTDADGDEPEAAPLPPKSKNSRPKAVCGCDEEAPIWLSRRVLKSGKVGCFECGQRYRAADPEDDPDE